MRGGNPPNTTRFTPPSRPQQKKMDALGIEPRTTSNSSTVLRMRDYTPKPRAPCAFPAASHFSTAKTGRIRPGTSYG